MQTKLTFFTIVALSIGAAGVMSADPIRAPATRPHPPRHARSAPKPPVLPPAPRAPDCAAVGAHLAALREAPKLARFFVEKCASQKWSENVRLCILDADAYQRAKIDCTDEHSATSAEVAALPAHLKCDVLAQHWYTLANGPDGKFTRIKAKDPARVTRIDRLAIEVRGELAAECEQRPWTVERRTCVAASKTHAAYGNCGR